MTCPVLLFENVFYSPLLEAFLEKVPFLETHSLRLTKTFVGDTFFGGSDEPPYYLCLDQIPTSHCFILSLSFRIRRNETHLDNLLQEFSLMFLPHLTSLSLTDVDLATIINISVFCPDLTHLAISKSEVLSKERSQIKTCFFF